MVLPDEREALAAPVAATENGAMTTPTTTIDRRYSQPDADATPWEDALGVLEGAQLSWLSTVRPDGRPHVTPVVAVWADDALHFMTGAHEQKSANLRANPHVAVTTGANTWDDGLDVVVEGRAELVTDESELRRLAEAWATRWDGRWTLGVVDGGLRHFDDGEPLPHVIEVYTVRPTTAYGHAKGVFAHTTYRFAKR